jgi:hypothetical protein
VTGGRWRGWLAILALLLIANLSEVPAGLLVFVPFALLAVALPPRRPIVLFMGLLLLALTFLNAPPEAAWYVQRGWALLLGGWFLAAVALLPRSNFLPRALAAVTATFATAAALFLAAGADFARIDAGVSDRLRAEADTAVLAWRRWDLSAAMREQLEASVYQVADLRALLFPCVLALASLAALAVAWWAVRRLNGVPERPLAPLREFRFPDALVWLVIAGVALVLLPVSGLADRAGSNLLTFMAALYALRGVAVLLVVGGATGPFGMVVAAALLLLLYPVVVITTVLVGLSDTWLDIRTRRRAPPEPGA